MEKPAEEDTATERISRRTGTVSNVLRKIPRAYKFVPRLLQFAVVEGLVTALQVTAGVTGVVGMFGMGIAGAMEIAEGVKKRDGAKVVAGAGEMSRGFTVGALTASEFLSLGPHQATARGVADGLAAVHGALTLAGGVMKIRQGHKVEGYLEIGVAGATLAAAGGLAPGPMLGLAVAMNTAGFAYRNQEKIKKAGQAVAHRTSDLWRKFKDVFR